jgi:6-phospho-beta-glucosidase
MQQVKACERLTLQAATEQNPDAALQAFALHPLVDSATVARQLLDGYRTRIPLVAEALGGR